MATYLLKPEAFMEVMNNTFGKITRIAWDKQSDMNIDYFFDNYNYYISHVVSGKNSETGIVYEDVVYDISDPQYEYAENKFVSPLRDALGIDKNDIIDILVKNAAYDENGIPTEEKVCIMYSELIDKE